MFVRGWNSRFRASVLTKLYGRSIVESNPCRLYATPTILNVAAVQEQSEQWTTNAAQKRKIIFVLGGPGAGKGTQCEKLSAEYGITHLSAGELLRREIQTGSSEGQLIDTYLKQGRIVPVEISLGLLKRQILATCKHRYLIDGFPRNHDNLNGWMKIMADVCDTEMIVFLECNETELERRIIERGRTSNRSDDNLQTAKKRFTTFQEETMPVVRHFIQAGADFNLVRINGDRPIDNVYSELKSSLHPFLQRELIALNQQLNQQESRNAFEGEATQELVDIKDLHATYSAYLSNGVYVKRKWNFKEGSWSR